MITSVVNWQGAVVQAAETGLRGAIEQSDLDQILKDRTMINTRLLELLGQTCEQRGMAADAVKIRDLDIPEQMQRAIAREAEAICEKRARVIKAEGEKDASQTLADAARNISEVLGAHELRRLQALSETASNTTRQLSPCSDRNLECARRICQVSSEKQPRDTDIGDGRSWARIDCNRKVGKSARVIDRARRGQCWCRRKPTFTAMHLNGAAWVNW